MNLKIELHDSHIEKITTNGTDVHIIFDSLVVLNITDEFGFKFDKTTFNKGSFIIKDAQYENLPNIGVLAGGHLRLGEKRYDLISVNLEASEACVLFLTQDSNHYKIFGKGFICSILED